ncbi:bifunctional DNA-binding transcriptional regulator/antitoxin component of YhaV-PrlF toxin-antitoxin module [Actinopolyspora biskrensis]|uniref:Bifunctional DNA-binding transcriptional regulator/antitoxin component of YhaV-PrlF toxin-antitoxin module n=1 Tax=Actinopolyspora biskrensis TaxID=1470178 RepID=A0A852YU14_9ACTN|nr:hypothetical protein [Actinopolyspora biskrensis]NYH77222.1 bifunctional DNA-binding transcriptional regulator/antitoxin component of YhaV-PrlF toxin-antitoxin module [Actinopolyspora biskrensis]
MSESVVPGLAPSGAGDRADIGGGSGSARAVRAMPLAVLPALRVRGSRCYRIVALDDRGRLAESAVIAALGWRPGQRLAIRVVEGVVLIEADGGGVFRLSRRCHVPLPAPVRRWCALGAGDRVLLVAEPARGRLTVYSLTALDGVLSSVHERVWGEAE